MNSIPQKPLGHTDLKVSIMGFGTGPLGNDYGQLNVVEAYRAIHYAIDRGINYFDSSPFYGRTLSETRLGEALAGGYRQKIVLATKAGRYDRPLETGFDFSYDRIISSCEESLTRLKTDYIDLFQLHDIEFRPHEQIINEAWPAMQKLKQEGKVRYIGITGYPVHHLKFLAETLQVDTILSYCHYNLMNTMLDDELTPFAKEKGIGLINASGLHMGVLTSKGGPEWHPAPKRVVETARKVAAYCQAHGADIATLALQFAMGHDYLSSNLVGIGTMAEAEQNLGIIGTPPDPDLLAEVQKMITPIFNISWNEGMPEYFEPGSVPKYS